MKYRVSVVFVFSQRELLTFLDNNRNVDIAVETLSDQQPATDDPVAIYTPQRGPRRQRRSKVIDAIMGSLEMGKGNVADLKSALLDAGMAPSSLTTGLTALQKAGTIKSDGRGSYSLVKEAAE